MVLELIELESSVTFKVLWFFVSFFIFFKKVMDDLLSHGYSVNKLDKGIVIKKIKIKPKFDKKLFH